MDEWLGLFERYTSVECVNSVMLLLLLLKRSLVIFTQFSSPSSVNNVEGLRAK